MTDTQPNIANLAAALASAQAEFTPIAKDKTAKAGTYSYNYADLASVRDAVTPALAKHGLAVIQTFRPNGGERQYVVTTLAHKSGEAIESVYPIQAIGKQQEIGSAITYARRYSLCAILGVVAEDDDDGNAADKTGAQTEAKNGNGHISAEQKEVIIGLLKETQSDVGRFLQYMRADSVDAIASKDFDKAKKALESKRTPK